MEKIAELERQGFETAFKAHSMPLMIRVAAYNKEGRLLRWSRTVTTVPIIRPREVKRGWIW